MTKAIRLAVTMGDPGGIGPEIIAKAAHQLRDDIEAGRLQFIVLGSAEALDRACTQTGITRDTLPLTMIDVGPVEGEIQTGKALFARQRWRAWIETRKVSRAAICGGVRPSAMAGVD